MKNEQIKAEILKVFSSELDELLEDTDKIEGAYDYEERYLLFSRNIGRIVLQKIVGEIPGNRNKKKLHTCLGEIELAKNHKLAQTNSTFGISKKLQEVICLVGQSQVFADGETLFSEMMGISVCGKQIQRVSEYYGQRIEETEAKSIEQGEPSPLTGNGTDITYVMPDGSMLFTRENGWKEIKVARLFSQSDNIAIQENRNEIAENLFVCHLGGLQGFLKKLEHYADDYKKKVCIADGAKWIWLWATSAYPEMTQILDFFHALEKLGDFASKQFIDEGIRQKWMSDQKERLLNNGVDEVIEMLTQLKARNKEAEKLRIDVTRYYQNNKIRMQYKTYQEAGYLIGSGPIESAHRHVVQQRLKLSGQRWSEKGAQQIVNLRAYQKSNRWTELVNLIKFAA